MRKTKVFISCGQRDNTDELKIAQQVADLLRGKDNEPYIAKMIQGLGALTQEIYKQLDDSEYFLFIDFKRERICSEISGIQHRGSLFSHQELAIASYLEKHCLTFQEDGLRLEGIQPFIISNPHIFKTSEDLLKQINKEVNIKWHTGWKNELEIIEANPIFQDARMFGGPMDNHNTRWYHVAVNNNHPFKHAKNCYAYIMGVHCGLAKNVSTRNIETHWSGYGIPAMTILPGDARAIDIFFCDLSTNNSKLYFNPFTTSGHYHPIPLEYDPESSTEYHIFRIKVFSDNFPASEKKFQLTFKGDVNAMSFSPAP